MAVEQQLRALAEGGDQEALYELGARFYSGDDVEQDKERAESLLLRAALRQHAEAAKLLGCLYERRLKELPPADPRRHKVARRSIACFRLASIHGAPDGALLVATCYSTGIHCKVDDARAVRWLRQGALAGHREAQFELGVMLQTGKGVAQDEVEAVEWFRRAAAQQYEHALLRLGFAHLEGRGASRRKDLAVSYFRKAAELGNSDGADKFAQCLAAGEGIPQDDVAAVAWFRHAEKSGHLAASARLGTMYLEGRGGLPRDEGEAFRRFDAAAKQGNAVAEAKLGDCYWKGIGCKADRQKARELFHSATVHGYPKAALEFTRDRPLSLADILAARTWLYEAAQQGDLYADFWRNRLLFSRYRSSLKTALNAMVVLGYLGLAYHLVESPFTINWIGVAAFLSLFLVVPLIGIAVFSIAQPGSRTKEEIEVPSRTKSSPGWKSLWRAPGEDGFFLAPLLYIGITPLTAAACGVAFTLAHLPAFATRAAVFKGACYFFVAWLLLPHFGLWSIVLGHVLLNATLLVFEHAIDSEGS